MSATGPRLRVAATRHIRSRRRSDPVADRLRRRTAPDGNPAGPGRDRVPRLRGSPDSTNARRREIGLTCRGPVPAAELESYAMTVITEREEEQISKANASGLAPVVFVHGLWLLPSSWDRWATVFEEAGSVPLTPSWHDDPDTVEEANELYATFAVPAAGTPLFQAATANLNPFAEAKADSKNPDRGPMLIISGEKDNTAPPAITNAIYKQQSRNAGVTETVLIPGRGHALVIDSGWREVCDISLAFVRRFVR